MKLVKIDVSTQFTNQLPHDKIQNQVTRKKMKAKDDERYRNYLI